MVPCGSPACLRNRCASQSAEPSRHKPPPSLLARRSLKSVLQCWASHSEEDALSSGLAVGGR
eukprot:1607304-Alexandrium_andersonii.AAC.1